MGIKNAEKGGYAVGAFNVYNLEGVEAVVSAAEEEQSPAILQVRSNYTYHVPDCFILVFFVYVHHIIYGFFR